LTADKVRHSFGVHFLHSKLKNIFSQHVFRYSEYYGHQESITDQRAIQMPFEDEYSCRCARLLSQNMLQSAFRQASCTTVNYSLQSVKRVVQIA